MQRTDILGRLLLVPLALAAQEPPHYGAGGGQSSISARGAAPASSLGVPARCFWVERQATWSEDSLRFPATFTLLPEPFTALGYHRSDSFKTDLPPLRSNEPGALGPIWFPVTPTVVGIDPDPSPTGGPRHEVQLGLDEVRGTFVLTTRWIDFGATQDSAVVEVRRVAHGTGRFETCERGP